MSRFRKVFPLGKVFLPVVHVENEAQALRNSGVAFENGADGIFLIGHGLPAQLVEDIYSTVREAHKEKWIGINFLDLPTPLAIGFASPTVSGIWADDGLIDPDQSKPAKWAELQWRILDHEREEYFSPLMLYFGGVAFKGQKSIEDVARVASLAASLMDVVTTSGPETGRAADPRKIELMKKAIGNDGTLGLASGLTSENVRLYRDCVDVFLVASGISDSFVELNPKKTEEFARSCR